MRIENTGVSEERCLSRDELVGYSDGSLEQAEQDHVEAHLKDCEMCAMATGGFSGASNIAMLGVLDNDLKELVDAKLASGKAFNFQQMLNIVLGTMVIGGVVFYFMSKNEQQVEKSGPVAEGYVEETGAEIEPYEVKTKPEIEDEVSSYPKIEAATPVKEIDSEPNPENKREPVSVKFMPMRQVDARSLDGEEKEESRVRISSNTIYVQEMKTYDYEELYQREHEYNWRNPNLGVSAEYEHGTGVISYPNDPDYRTIWKSYEEILNTALTDYKRGKYDKALISLNLLLDDYPSDINGLFYKGLCLYYANKFDKCIRYMTSVSSDVNPTFDQESEWFIALSYVKLRKRTIAVEKFKAIVKYDGFYKKQAIKQLKYLE